MVVHTADGVGEKPCHRKDCALAAVFAVGDGVGENHFHERAGIHAFAGGIAHDCMRAEGAHALCAVFHHQVGGFCNGSGSVYHVVHQNHILVLDISDYSHLGHDIGFRTLFVAQNQRHIEVFGIAVGAFGSADVGSGYHQVGKFEALDVGDEHRGGIQVVDGDVEEALYLVGVH